MPGAHELRCGLKLLGLHVSPSMLDAVNAAVGVAADPWIPLLGDNLIHWPDSSPLTARWMQFASPVSPPDFNFPPRLFRCQSGTTWRSCGSGCWSRAW